jgi:hypothetical protein
MAIKYTATKFVETEITIDRDYPLYVHIESTGRLKKITEKLTIVYEFNRENFSIFQTNGPRIYQIDLKNIIEEEEFIKLKAEFLEKLYSAAEK